MFGKHRHTAYRLAAALLAAAAGPAQAISVSLNGTIFDSCILTLSTPGTLAADSSGTVLTSETAGGLPAIMAIVALGSGPQILFTAPALTTSPGGYGRTPTVAIRYTSLRGAAQVYTSSASSFSPSALIDTVTIHARAVDPLGYAAGGYTISTVATCQQ